MATLHFSLDQPARGSNFGNWGVPLNDNFLKIDTQLWNLLTSNKDISDITLENYHYDGILKYQPNGIIGLAVRHGSAWKRLAFGEEDLILSVANQNALSNGNNADDLHFHEGDSNTYFKVNDPDAMSQSHPDIGNQGYMAIPYSLYSSLKTSLENEDQSLQDQITATDNKINLFTTDGQNIQLAQSLTVTGNIVSNSGIKARFGSTGHTIQIGGGTSNNEYEIVLSQATYPLNIKSATGGTPELLVGGGKVHTAYNGGEGTSFDSDMVDGKHVNDGEETADVLWTAERIVSEIDGRIWNVNENPDIDTTLWLGDKIQEEITTEVNALSATLMAEIIKVMTPVGTVSAYAGITPPAGYLECNGDIVPDKWGSVTQNSDHGNSSNNGIIADFSSLYDVISNRYGAPGQLPDLRGEFIRGFDNGRGVDANRVAGATQEDTIQNITGTFRSDNNGIDDESTGAFYRYNNDIGGGWDNASGGVAIGFNAANVVRTSDETRPKNIAMMYIIKY